LVPFRVVNDNRTVVVVACRVMMHAGLVGVMCEERGICVEVVPGKGPAPRTLGHISTLAKEA
jgi:hypothetical protein